MPGSGPEKQLPDLRPIAAKRREEKKMTMIMTMKMMMKTKMKMLMMMSIMIKMTKNKMMNRTESNPHAKNRAFPSGAHKCENNEV